MNSEKKLKLMVASLKDKQLLKFFQSYINCFATSFKKNIRQISFNCYESVCQFDTKVVNGYGKNYNQAFINGIRNLIQLLLQEPSNQTIMRQCFKKVSAALDSQKKLLSTQKTLKTLGDSKQEPSPMIMSTNLSILNKGENQKTIKQEIFEYLNLQNLKISNPNPTGKAKEHEKYLNQSGIDEQEQLRITLQKIAQMEKQIADASKQNKKLKQRLGHFYQEKDKENRPSDISQKYAISRMGVKAKMDNYMNYSTTNPDQKAKIRSTSMDPSQKYQYIPYSGSQVNSRQGTKKMQIPKLNLQVLPNYHGKSNKSLNQSLLQVYQKAKK